MNITIKLKKLQIVNDLVVECNIIGRTLALDDKLAEQASLIMTPDDEETKPIVARAITTAFAEVKNICRRYLVYGRDTDDNRLEAIDERTKASEQVSVTTNDTECRIELLTGLPYRISIDNESSVTVKDIDGNRIAEGEKLHFDYTPLRMNERLILTATKMQDVWVTYNWGAFGTLELILEINNFNAGVTDKLKSAAHKYIVDSCMYEVLKNQLPDKAETYLQSAVVDKEEIRSALTARMVFGRRAADWS